MASAHQTHGHAAHYPGGATDLQKTSLLGQLQIGGLAGHNCGDHGAIGDATPGLTAGRADAFGATDQVLGSSTPIAAYCPDSTLASSRQAPRSETSSPPRAPLVLRI